MKVRSRRTVRRSSYRLPPTTAATAFDLLKEVRGLILADPRRYAQPEVLYHRKPGTVLDMGWDGSVVVPPCGTVGCRAGWIVELVGKMKEEDTLVAATRILGLTVHETSPFFSGSAAGSAQCGTKAHARDGARGITEFMKTYKTQLQATPIRVTRRR